LCIVFFSLVLLASKSRALQPGDRNKFLPLDSPFAPFSIPAWSAALKAVDQSPSRLLEASKSFVHFGHYALPDPGLFINTTVDTKAKVRYIEPWLRLRDIWLMRLAKEPSIALSNQNWRTFLAADINARADKQTKAADRLRNTIDLVIPRSGTYSGLNLKTRNSSKAPLFWQGNEFPPGVLPPKCVIQQILWELYELNFIHELLSLDRRACAELDVSDTAQLLDRQTKITKCFPIDSFQHITIPSRNRGLAAEDFNERFHFVTALFLVMKSWRGVQPKIFDASEENVRNFSRLAATSFENVVAKYYCQQFFNYFGRAAQIPHRLLATVDN
jgi:hypothetical protein